MIATSLGELVTSFEGTGILPISWNFQQSRGHEDPVSVAWAACTSPWLMMRLLQLVRASSAEHATAAWMASASELGHGPPDESRVCPHCAHAVRAAVPPPTLSDTIAALRQLKAEDMHNWTLGVDPSAMIAAAVRSGADQRLVVRAVCRCARRTLDFVTGLNARAKWSLAVAEKWATDDDVTRAELYNAVSAAQEALEAASSTARAGRDGARTMQATALALKMAVALVYSIAFGNDKPLPQSQYAVEASAWAIACARHPADDESCPDSRALLTASAECARIVGATIGALPNG